MVKTISLLFCLFLAKVGHAQAYTTADSVIVSRDTLQASFHSADIISGDTTYFGMYGEHDDKLLYFFQKHLRVPMLAGNSVFGTIRVYFIVDLTGRITSAWYDPSGNTDIGLSVLSVVNQLPVIKPTIIKGEPMITKVLLKVLIAKDEHTVVPGFVPDFTEVVGN